MDKPKVIRQPQNVAAVAARDDPHDGQLVLGVSHVEREERLTRQRLELGQDDGRDFKDVACHEGFSSRAKRSLGERAALGDKRAKLARNQPPRKDANWTRTGTYEARNRLVVFTASD